MYDSVILFLVCFFAGLGGAYLTSVIENLIKRNKARKRYYRHLENENVRLHKTVDFLKLELAEKPKKHK